MMFTQLLDKFKIDPVEFKKNFLRGFVLVDSFDLRLTRMETKLDMLLDHAGLDSKKINDDLAKVSADLKQITTKEIGHA